MPQDLFNKAFTFDQASGQYGLKTNTGDIKAFQQGYNDYLSHTLNYFKDKGYLGDLNRDDAYNMYRFGDEEELASVGRGFDDKYGNITSTRRGVYRNFIPRNTLNQLNERGIFTSEDLYNNRETEGIRDLFIGNADKKIFDDFVTEYTPDAGKINYGLGHITTPVARKESTNSEIKAPAGSAKPTKIEIPQTPG
jgi:hypothetical protein